MKRFIITVVCFVLLVSVAGAKEQKNGKKAVKKKMKFLIALVGEKAPPSPVCMVGYNKDSQLHAVGIDLDGDNLPDRVDYYNCNEYGKSPVLMEMHGSWRLDRFHQCIKVGFADWN